MNEEDPVPPEPLSPEPQPVSDPPASAPVADVTRQKVKKLSQALSDSINVFLTQSGHNANDAKAQVQSYIQKVEPYLEQQVDRAVLDPEVAYANVKFIWAAVAGEAGRVSLGAIYRERQVITAMTVTLLHAAIAMA